jgi:hypothetical protein
MRIRNGDAMHEESADDDGEQDASKQRQRKPRRLAICSGSVLNPVSMFMV